MERVTINRVMPLAAGLGVFAITVFGWLYAETHGVDSGALFYMASPVIAALFLAPGVNRAADAATEAARNTNGPMDARIRAGVAEALAARDNARALQAVRDSEAVKDANV